MSLTTDQIIAAVMELDVAEREALMSELTSRIPRPDQAAFDAACVELSEHRFQKLKADPSRGRTLEQVLETLQQRTQK